VGSSGEFSADWLALREPADVRARSAALTRAVTGRFQQGADLHVLDLGAGTGANLRYLTPFFDADKLRPHWLLVDNDSGLLARATAPPGVLVETRVLDLAGAFEPGSGDLCRGRALVTASALLDLVPARWLDALAQRCLEAGAAVLFVLSYNGDIRCTPEEPEDELVRGLVNQHQRTDKGFGPALGPDASAVAARAFGSRGYQVRRERSDWVLAAGERALQTQLIEGWAEAAEAIAPDRAPQLDGWKDRRLGHVAAGRSSLVVGHDDIAAWLA
jgi:hypothetical protein